MELVVIGVPIAVLLTAVAIVAMRRPPEAPPPPPPQPPPVEETQALAPRRTMLLTEWDGPPGVAGWLVALSGTSPFTTSVVHRSGETTIGRDTSCGIVVADGAVSKIHCKIIGASGYFLLVEVKDKDGELPLNPVLVDNAPIAERDAGIPLSTGARIKIGQTEFAWKAIVHREGA